MEPRQSGGKKIARKIADRKIGHRVQQRAGEIELQELAEAHLHAARQRRGHGVDAGNKLGDDQRDLAALVERFGGTENAGLGIHREAAKKSEQGPASVASQPELCRVADQERDHRGQKNCRSRQSVRCGGRSGRHQSDRRREGQADRLGQQQGERQGIAVARHHREQVSHTRS